MTHERNTCEPAFSVIERLGGRVHVAKALELTPGALCRWCAQPPRGTGGRIPQQHWPALLRLAAKQGRKMTVRTLAGM